MSSSSQTLIQQTKAYVANTFTAVKDVLGFDSHPQSKVLHKREYLNDIAKGNWKSLNRVPTCSVKYYPVIGVPLNYRYPQIRKFNMKFKRCPFLEQVKQGKVLKPVVTNDKTKLIYFVGKDYKYKPKGNRKQLLEEIRCFGVNGKLKRSFEQEFLNDISRGKWKRLNHVPTECEKKKLLKEIEGFSRSDLKKVSISGGEKGGLIEKAKGFMGDKLEQVKEVLGMDIHPQSKIEHDKPFLNDIAKGNWESLNHVSDICERQVPVVGVEGVNLGWKSDVKIKKNNRKNLLNEVKKGCELNHVKTVEKNQVKIGSDYKMKRGVDRKQLLNEISEFEADNLSRVHVGSS